MTNYVRPDQMVPELYAYLRKFPYILISCDNAGIGVNS